jgi:hypothetical protein
MTLEEERNYLAKAIVTIRRQASDRYAELTRRLPDSFFDQEQRSHHMARIRRERQFQEEPLLIKLTECFATEECGDLRYLNPVTWEHRMAAEKLIEAARECR